MRMAPNAELFSLFKVYRLHGGEEGLSFVTLAKLLSKGGLSPRLIGHKDLKIMVSHAKLGGKQDVHRGLSYGEFCEVLLRAAVLISDGSKEAPTLASQLKMDSL